MSGGDLHSLALDAARAGAAAIASVDRARLDVRYKNDGDRDPATAADRASDEAIRALLTRRRPGDAVVTEESGTTRGASGVRWIVDPLDGTVNFLHGVARYAVSVAAESTEERRVVAAAVVEPASSRWLALEPSGVVSGSEPAVVDAGAIASRALVAFAVPNDATRRVAAYGALRKLAPRVQDLRNFGSTVCDLAAVARGELDAFVTFDPAPWDVVAGVALVEAAGGRSARWTWSEGRDVVACGSPDVVDAIGACLGAASVATTGGPR